MEEVAGRPAARRREFAPHLAGRRRPLPDARVPSQWPGPVQEVWVRQLRKPPALVGRVLPLRPKAQRAF
eukprot:6034878-Alexandrium_andersonii.AAC.1